MTLYHYCSVNTFFSIINSGEVRLSHLNMSNDTLEGRWAQRRLIEASLKCGLQHKYKEAFENYLNSFVDLWGGLGFCLSKEADMLSQWRAYADNGCGFAIGFNPSQLIDAVRKSVPSAQLLTVEYDENRQINSLTRLAAELTRIVNEGAFEPLRFNLSSNDDLGNERHAIKALRQSLEHMTPRLRPFMYSMKHPSFREEKEMRIFSFFDYDSEEVKFQPSLLKLTPYRSVKIGYVQGLIQEIIVGPRNITPRLPVEVFLRRSLKADVDVRFSEVPYR
ncbi:DUF2971 domain-containing protein [Rhizobium sp. TRM95796]|uniref:DUF2971 domain-containing protein n=1 Tax=Rhizobium sp. TRM95796 TaxID=2979862 RepID=UPI0021E864EA|nr:DUF2971 domain-containing protein [Rhizobium sp. TRM95796]MCV3764468.1 DUF2971 domain-containing protein [Rhizobium sp. TRM95796]